MPQGIRQANHALLAQWRKRFDRLPPEARQALREALLDLRRDALGRAELQWRRHKAPMAYYWKVVGVYAGHLARSLRPAPELKPASGAAASASAPEPRMGM